MTSAGSDDGATGSATDGSSETAGSDRAASGGPGDGPPGEAGGQSRGGRPGRARTPDVRTDGGREQEMTLFRRVSLVLLGVVLTVSIVGAHGVIAGQRTALSSSYVADTMAEENAFAGIEGAAEEFVLSEAAGTVEAGGAIPNADRIIEQAVRDLVTPSFVERVARENLQRLYTYLHGNAALQLSIETAPITDNVSGVVAAQLRNRSVSTLLAQSSFSGSFSALNIDTETVVRAYEDRETYREVQQRISTQLERTGATTDDLNQSVTGGSDIPESLRQPVFRMQRTVVLGFGSDLSHAAFRRKMNESRDEFAAAAGEFAQRRIADRVPARIDIDERVGDRTRSQLATAASAVQLADTLALVLPAVAVLVVLLIGGLSGSIGYTARVLGTSLLLVGAGGIVSGFVGRGPALDAVRATVEGAAPFVRSTVVALIEGIFGTLTGQSFVLAALGLVSLGVWFVVTRLEPTFVPRDLR